MWLKAWGFEDWSQAKKRLRAIALQSQFFPPRCCSSLAHHRCTDRPQLTCTTCWRVVLPHNTPGIGHTDSGLQVGRPLAPATQEQR